MAERAARAKQASPAPRHPRAAGRAAARRKGETAVPARPPGRRGDGDLRGEIARALLAWFARAGRKMPWRETRDPYRVWVSEIMLQQTTVAAVPPYYRRFLAEFPTVEALAAAPADAVMKAWEGLGYYSRARNLHAAAKQVVARHAGRLPAEVEALVALPGVGRSTAGAIAALAFGKDEPILDGNVRRVLCRLFAVREDPARRATSDRLWRESRALILPGRGRDAALALMDLGSLVCTPRRPDCPACPVRAHCLACQTGIQEAVPRKAPRKAKPHFDVAVAVIEDGNGRVLLVRRPGEGLLGGMWAFPGGKREPGEGIEQAVVREVRQDLGIRVRVVAPLAAVPHAYTHYRVTIHPFRCRPAGKSLVDEEDRRWVPVARLGAYALPRSNRKIAETLSSERTVRMRRFRAGGHPTG